MGQGAHVTLQFNVGSIVKPLGGQFLRARPRRRDSPLSSSESNKVTLMVSSSKRTEMNTGKNFILMELVIDHSIANYEAVWSVAYFESSGIQVRRCPAVKFFHTHSTVQCAQNDIFLLRNQSWKLFKYRYDIRLWVVHSGTKELGVSIQPSNKTYCPCRLQIYMLLYCALPLTLREGDITVFYYLERRYCTKISLCRRTR
jgi:hypothetical protein